MRLRQRLGDAIMLVILFIVLWQIWDRTRIYFVVNIPWWVAVILFLLLAWVIERLVYRIIGR